MMLWNYIWWNEGLWCIDPAEWFKYRESSTAESGASRVCDHRYNQDRPWESLSRCRLMCWYPKPCCQGCRSFGTLLSLFALFQTTCTLFFFLFCARIASVAFWIKKHFFLVYQTYIDNHLPPKKKKTDVDSD